MRVSAAIALVLAAVACSSNGAQPRGAGPSRPATPPRSEGGAHVDAATPGAREATEVVPPEEVALLLEDRSVLADLEARGMSVGELGFGVRAKSTRELASSANWQILRRTIHADVRELYSKDTRYGVGMRHTHRGFDLGWLDANDAHFALAAVVNRVDRRTFEPGTCGELRFVYRLTYAKRDESAGGTSRLPATLNVVFLHPSEGDEDCARAARALEHLAPPKGRLKSVEINLQSSRWPSTVRPDLGGHADYLMRVFRPGADGALAPAPLENVPDAPRLARDAALRARFVTWLRAPSTTRAAEEGTALLPDDLAARRAVSVTPRGLARAQNRPFSTLAARLGVSDVPAETLRLLDGMSCPGCHQSRSIAGFHVLGAESDDDPSANSLAIAHSPHVEDELARRRAYVDAVLSHRTPTERRAAAERPDGPGTIGSACGLRHFPSWTCADGLRCARVDEDDVGQCVPASPEIGSPCQVGSLDAARDRMASITSRACGPNAVCETPRVGFPGGMCSGGCDDLAPSATCGAIALLTPFNDCLARGEPFDTCAKHSFPAALRRCSASEPCRPDYVCARTTSGQGACLPPYFILQMRVDGHPTPRR